MDDTKKVQFVSQGLPSQAQTFTLVPVSSMYCKTGKYLESYRPFEPFNKCLTFSQPSFHLFLSLLSVFPPGFDI